MKTLLLLSCCILILSILLVKKKKEGYENPTLSYDVNLSLDAHSIAFQEICKKRGLRVVKKEGQDPYCIIDNEARCRQRDDELQTLAPDDDDANKRAFWYPNAESEFGGSCVEVYNIAQNVCDNFNKNLPKGVEGPALYPIRGKLQCDMNKGYCDPVGFNYDIENLSEQASHNVDTCRILPKVCKGQSYRDYATNDNGDVLGDCYITPAQSFFADLMGGTTLYGRYKDVGEDMARKCSNEFWSEACFGALHQTIFGVPFNFAKDLGSRMAAESINTFKNSINDFITRPSATSAANLYTAARSISPAGQVSAMQAKMMQQLAESLGVPKQYSGIVNWGFRRIGDGDIGIAVALEVMIMAQRGLKYFMDYLNISGKWECGLTFGLSGCGGSPPTWLGLATYRFMSTLSADAQQKYARDLDSFHTFVMVQELDDGNGFCIHPSGGAENPTVGTELVYWDSECGLPKTHFTMDKDHNLKHKNGLCVEVGSDNLLYLDNNLGKRRLQWIAETEAKLRKYYGDDYVNTSNCTKQTFDVNTLTTTCVASETRLERLTAGELNISVDTLRDWKKNPTGACDATFTFTKEGLLKHLNSGNCIHPDGGNASNGTRLRSFPNCSYEKRIELKQQDTFDNWKDIGDISSIYTTMSAGKENTDVNSYQGNCGSQQMPANASNPVNSSACVQEIWKKAGCTQPISQSNMDHYNTNYNYKQLVSHVNSLKTSQSADCVSKLAPASSGDPCALYTANSTAQANTPVNSKECINAIYKAKGCDVMPDDTCLSKFKTRSYDYIADRVRIAYESNWNTCKSDGNPPVLATLGLSIDPCA